MPVRKQLPLRALVLAPGRTAASAKAALPALDVTLARSLDDACRLVGSRCPDVIVVEEEGDAAAGIRAALGSASTAPRLFEGALDDVSLQEAVMEAAVLERAERVAAAQAELLGATQALGETVQWQHDPEARSFRWLSTGCARFASLTGDGSVHERFSSFVHPDDRARAEHEMAGHGAGTIDYRLVLPDGAVREVVQKTLVRRDPDTGRRVRLGTVRDVTETRNRERTLERLAHYDAATGLPNRAHISRYLQAALDSTRPRAGGIAIISFGIDAFRTIEDTFGRSASEAVLVEVAARLRALLEQGRETDGLTARHGPHELLVVLRDASAEDAAAFFARASSHLAAPINLAGTPIVVTCSGGVATTADAAPREAETMLVHADAALHVAMREGRARLVVHNQKMRDTLERKLGVEQRLRDGLAHGVGLELHYQPKVDARSGRVRAVEALLRSSPDPRGAISPLELVSVSEDCGLVHALGDFVLRAACTQARQWARERRRPLRVAVNVSGQQLARAGFADRVAEVLAETGLSPELLELEITEGVMMADVEGARRLLMALKELGVRIALDDFGTGYSSLAYLTRLPIDTLKIDRSFVTEIGTSKKGEAILTAIIELSKSLGLEVVAEGVETAAQQTFLANQGELEIQGWLHSKALPARDLRVWLDRRAPCASVIPPAHGTHDEVTRA